MSRPPPALHKIGEQTNILFAEMMRCRMAWHGLIARIGNEDDFNISKALFADRLRIDTHFEGIAQFINHLLVGGIGRITVFALGIEETGVEEHRLFGRWCGCQGNSAGQNEDGPDNKGLKTAVHMAPMFFVCRI